MPIFLALLAALSVWDYPERFPKHERLRREFVSALRAQNVAAAEKACREGVKLLPDDPTWRFNLACTLSRQPKHREETYTALEEAIDLGFRDAKLIAGDNDLKALKDETRFKELVEYAVEMRERPLLFGPHATVDATGPAGSPISLGEQNLEWNFDFGCFDARLKLSGVAQNGNSGDLYVNRDGFHSLIKSEDYPGLTAVRFDSVGRERGMDIAFPNTFYPYPVFGNSSRAFLHNPFWRSIPRALVTTDAGKLKTMVRFYLSNQLWVFPAVDDVVPCGTNGDVFASIAPYWLTTVGRSWSDLPYLRGALEASRSLDPKVKQEIVRRGLLAPTIMTLIRKSLKSVTNEVDYLTARAHPTALPQDGLSVRRLIAAAKALTLEQLPPLAAVSVKAAAPKSESAVPELTYSSPFAWGFILRSDDAERTFELECRGAKEFAFVQTHGDRVAAKIERLTDNRARISFPRAELSPTNRLDIAVFGRNPGTGWGAPSYVSFSRVDPQAPYSDPALTPTAKK